MNVDINKLNEFFQPATIKKSEKLLVREFDEITTNEYLAYVDDGPHSFDTSVKLSEKGIVEMATCDCNSKTAWCLHKISLLLHIKGNKKTKRTKVVKGNAKANKINHLLDSIPYADLKEWIRMILEEHKNLSQIFLHHFSSDEQVVTVEKVKEMTRDAVKSVVKNKKNIDATQVKQIISVWKIVHQPILETYKKDVSNQLKFDCFYAMMESCEQFAYSFNVNTVRFKNYIQELLADTLESILQINDETNWHTSIHFFINKLIKDSKQVNFFILDHIQKLITGSSPQRKSILISELMNSYKTNSSKNIFDYDKLKEKLFYLLVENNNIAEYLNLFTPTTWRNSYNADLINKYFDAQKYEHAEKLCLQQINTNYQKEYDVQYFLLLKQIYLITKNEEKLIEVIKVLFPLKYDYEEYKYIISKTKDEEEIKKFRTKVLSVAKNSMRNQNHQAAEFYFTVYYNEKNYKKLLELISDDIPIRLIVNHFDALASTNKMELLRNLLMRQQNYSWFYIQESTEEDSVYYPILHKLLLKYFTNADLLLVIKEQKRMSYYHYSDFFKYLCSVIQ